MSRVRLVDTTNKNMDTKQKKLTPKQETFCHEYLVDLCAAKAATRAGYSEKSVRRIGSQLIHNPIVQNRLAELRKVLQKGAVTPEMIIAEFAKIAFCNVGDFITDGNEIVDLSRMSRDKLAVIESIQSDIRHDGGKSEGYTEKVRFKLHDKIKALENLGKILGIYSENNKQLAETLATFLKDF